jgi:hypothetical protein
MKISKVLILFGILVSLTLIMSVPEAMAKGGGSGEGDDCNSNLNYKNIGGPYKGTLIGEMRADGKIYLWTANGSPLIRSNSDCIMEIPYAQAYNFGSFDLPEKPKDMLGWCRTGLKNYVSPGEYGEDMCPYGLPVAGYESIDASKPKFMPDGSFTVDIVIMPMYLSP